MLGYGCDVSQYPQFYDKYLDMNQVLPRPYMGSFEGFPGDKSIKKWVLDLTDPEYFFWECIEIRITSDSIDKKIAEKYWSNLKEKIDKAR